VVRPLRGAGGGKREAGRELHVVQSWKEQAGSGKRERRLKTKAEGLKLGGAERLKVRWTA